MPEITIELVEDELRGLEKSVEDMSSNMDNVLERLDRVNRSLAMFKKQLEDEEN